MEGGREAIKVARGRKKEGDFLNHIHWHLGTLPRQYQTDFYGTLETMATSKNVYGKCPFTISTLNFLISYCHFLFFQLIPSSPWTPVAVLPHLQSTDPITFALIITPHHVFTHTLIPCVHLQFSHPFLCPSPYSGLITTNVKWIVWPANLAAFPWIHFLSPRPSSHPLSSPLQPPMPLPTLRSQLMTWFLISLRGYKQPEEKFHMLWPTKLITLADSVPTNQLLTVLSVGKLPCTPLRSRGMWVWESSHAPP